MFSEKRDRHVTLAEEATWTEEMVKNTLVVEMRSAIGEEVDVSAFLDDRKGTEIGKTFRNHDGVFPRGTLEKMVIFVKNFAILSFCYHNEDQICNLLGAEKDQL